MAPCAPRRFSVHSTDRAALVAVLAVQRDAFGRVSEALGIPAAALPPLAETVVDLEALFDAGTRFFSAVDGAGVTVGTVRASEAAGGTVEIGRLAVASGWTRTGVATTLMDALEAAYPDATRFVLFTGSTALAPLALYAGRGYAETRRQDPGHVELVWLEKPGPRALNRSSAR